AGTSSGRGKIPRSSQAASAVVEAPDPTRIQEPTLIGEVTLKTRSMFRNRSGRPRSDTSSAGLTTSAPRPIHSDVRARRSFPAVRAARLSTDHAPARPPVKKEHGISGFQTRPVAIG